MRTDVNASPDGEPLSSEDLEEFSGRLDRVRAVMEQMGVDALLVADDDDAGRAEGGNVRYLTNVAAPLAYSDPIKLILVLPLVGEPTLVVPFTGLGSLPAIVRRRTWLTQVVSAGPVTLVETLRAFGAGARPQTMVADAVATALKGSGLEAARVGVCGAFTGLDETKSELPRAAFEPAAVEDDAGVTRDAVELVRCGTKSTWEVARMERAQDCVEAALSAFAAVLAAGASYNDALAEIDYAGRRAGAHEMFFPSSKGPEPWEEYSMPGWIEGRYSDGDMIAFEINARYDGYWAQLPRTWLVGSNPSKSQSHVYDTAKRASEVLRDRLEVGITGGELWDAAFKVVDDAGLEPWARYGHGMGLSQAEWFSVLPGDKSRVQEGQSIVVHASVVDRTTGNQGLIGEQYVMQDGRPRLLGRAPAAVDLVLGR